MLKRKIGCLIVLCFFILGCATSGGPKTNPAHESARDFTLPDQNGEMVTLGKVLETHRGAVIAFYPKDDSKN